MGYTILGNPQIIMQCNLSHLQLQILLALGHLCSRSNILQWIKNWQKLVGAGSLVRQNRQICT